MRQLARLAAAALLTVPPVAAGTASAAAPEPTPARLKTAANPVPGNYIVPLGTGVTAYILDTGIDYNHTEFGGPDATRATFGFDAINDGRNGQDCQGHGTHVAGTVAGKTYGIARKASLRRARGAVAASNQYDEETDFTNYGRCVSLYAPGAAIVSAKLGGGSVALDGTSMAAPHVAGIAALYKQAHPEADPGEIAEFPDNESTKDALKSVSKSSPNRLLFTAGL
ncbi:S8 family serine peptidase [Streptomyces sp. NPDC085639]|uniref:S8 family serine peptidase n=1 Tax=Streptomyces sp. NPDC085639 TaxID=3365734 RepID=UPI0037D45039